MSKRLFIVAGLSAGLVLAAHVIANPLLAAASLRDAISARDGAAVAERVDFPALKADLKADLETAIESEPNPMSREMARAMFGGMIDEMVTADAVRAWGQGRSAMSGSLAEIPSENDAKIDYGFGLTRFTLTFETDAGPMDVIFAPRGLTWKVVGVDMDLDRMMNAGG